MPDIIYKSIKYAIIENIFMLDTAIVTKNKFANPKIIPVFLGFFQLSKSFNSNN